MTEYIYYVLILMTDHSKFTDEQCDDIAEAVAEASHYTFIKHSFTVEYVDKYEDDTAAVIRIRSMKRISIKNLGLKLRGIAIRLLTNHEDRWSSHKVGTSLFRYAERYDISDRLLEEVIE